MKMKRIFTGVLSLTIALSQFTVWGMSAAIYDIQPNIETLQTVSTAARDNWQVVDDSARYQISGEVMRINLKNSASYTMEALAGADLYAAVNRSAATTLHFSAEVQATAPVQVEGRLNDRLVFRVTSSGTGAYETVSATFEILPTDAFLTGTGAPEDFKLVFTGTANSYVRDLRLRKEIDREQFADASGFAGINSDFDISVYATEAGASQAVLSVLSDSGESVLTTVAADLTRGSNTLKLEAALPQTLSAQDVMVLYVKDANGAILSERKQRIGSFYANGVNIIGSDLKVKEALTVFGAGEYLIEFDTVSDAVQVTLGGTTANAESGVCEIAITDGEIAALSADAVLQFSETVSNVTMRKTAD